MSTIDLKEAVRQRYGAIAETRGESCCGSTPDLECSDSEVLGYSEEELAALPEGADLGLGCGNPLALAAVREGDTVLDLGSGAGIDCFLAAKRVGESGRVIGVDMTRSMLAKARVNAEKGGFTNVEFREGEIEAMPVEDNSVDIVISNCVINLSTDKRAVFREIHRVLKPGGRFYISDIVLARPLPKAIAESASAYTACIGGALPREEYLGIIEEAGFGAPNILQENAFPATWITSDKEIDRLQKAYPELTADDIQQAAEAVLSLKLQGEKNAACCGPGCC